MSMVWLVSQHVEYSSLVFKSIKATSMLQRVLCRSWLWLHGGVGARDDIYFITSVQSADEGCVLKHSQIYHVGGILLIRRLRAIISVLSLRLGMAHWSCTALSHSPIVEGNSGRPSEGCSSYRHEWMSVVSEFPQEPFPSFCASFVI